PTREGTHVLPDPAAEVEHPLALQGDVALDEAEAALLAGAPDEAGVAEPRGVRGVLWDRGAWGSVGLPRRSRVALLHSLALSPHQSSTIVPGSRFPGRGTSLTVRTTNDETRRPDLTPRLRRRVGLRARVAAARRPPAVVRGRGRFY